MPYKNLVKNYLKVLSRKRIYGTQGTVRMCKIQICWTVGGGRLPWFLHSARSWIHKTRIQYCIISYGNFWKKTPRQNKKSNSCKKMHLHLIAYLRGPVHYTLKDDLHNIIWPCACSKLWNTYWKMPLTRCIPDAYNCGKFHSVSSIVV